MKNKLTEWVRFTTQDNEEIVFPLARILGDKPGPRVTITAGIHGAEYPGIAAAIRLFKTIEPENLCGDINIVTISNMKAFENRSMFVCPVDNKNPNRFFPGSIEGSYTDVLAYHLFDKVILESDYYMDLHSGDLVECIVPFTIYHTSGNSEVDSVSLEMAKHYGINRIISTTNEGKWPDLGTTYASASEAGIPSIIVEAGGIGQMDEQYITMHYNGMLNILKYLGCIIGKPALPQVLKYYSDFYWIYSTSKGILYRKVNVGEMVRKGQTLGIIEDYFGVQLEEVLSPSDGDVIFVTTSPAVNEKGLLMGIST